MLTLPFTLPAVHTVLPGTPATTPDVDTGGYDIMIGGHGFRLATDQQMSYQRSSEATTIHRFDSSLEPGEQTLSQLPWIKAQSSFHGGAGQLNLEQGFTAFQFQQEQVEHVRYDTSIGVDPWTPGELKRLADCHFYSFGFSSTCVVTGSDGTTDYAIIGGAGSLQQVAWSSGPDAAPTTTAIDLSSALFGGASNCTVKSLCTDGANYYALIWLTVAGSAAGVFAYVVKGSMSSSAAPTALYNMSTNITGVLGWSKARLIGALGGSVYELSTTAADTTLPAAKYTHPSANVVFNAVAESPGGVLVAALVGRQSSILELTLDTSGAVPTLSGGAVLDTLPPGEVIETMQYYVGSYLATGTSLGIRIGQFDSFSGGLKQGPLSVTTTQPVQALVGRDRFIFGSFTNQQADGKTGLIRVDISYTIDAAGRLAYAPDLRPPTTAPTGLGAVTGMGLLPLSNRIVYVTPEGIHVEGNGPGSDGDAWLRTSRIRYDTTEQKLFTTGRIEGTLDVSQVTITGIMPFTDDKPLGTFGFISTGNPGEFNLPDGLHEWMQLKFDLQGSACILNSYQVKAIPAPQRQHLIVLTVNCFRNEVDRSGLDLTDPETPRKRYQNMRDLESAGNEVRFVEFTNQGAVAELVVIDQMQFQSFSRPTVEDDFGGYITFKLRSTRG